MRVWNVRWQLCQFRPGSPDHGAEKQHPCEVISTPIEHSPGDTDDTESEERHSRSSMPTKRPWIFGRVRLGGGPNVVAAQVGSDRRLDVPELVGTHTNEQEAEDDHAPVHDPLSNVPPLLLVAA